MGVTRANDHLNSYAQAIVVPFDAALPVMLRRGNGRTIRALLCSGDSNGLGNLAAQPGHGPALGGDQRPMAVAIHRLDDGALSAGDQPLVPSLQQAPAGHQLHSPVRSRLHAHHLDHHLVGQLRGSVSRIEGDAGAVQQQGEVFRHHPGKVGLQRLRPAVKFVEPDFVGAVAAHDLRPLQILRQGYGADHHSRVAVLPGRVRLLQRCQQVEVGGPGGTAGRQQQEEAAPQEHQRGGSMHGYFFPFSSVSGLRSMVSARLRSARADSVSSCRARASW